MIRIIFMIVHLMIYFIFVCDDSEYDDMACNHTQGRFVWIDLAGRRLANYHNHKFELIFIQRIIWKMFQSLILIQ